MLHSYNKMHELPASEKLERRAAIEVRFIYLKSDRLV